MKFLILSIFEDLGLQANYLVDIFLCFQSYSLMKVAFKSYSLYWPKS